MLTDECLDAETVAPCSVAVARHRPEVGVGGAINRATETIFTGLRCVATTLYHYTQQYTEQLYNQLCCCREAT